MKVFTNLYDKSKSKLTKLQTISSLLICFLLKINSYCRSLSALNTDVFVLRDTDSLILAKV